MKGINFYIILLLIVVFQTGCKEGNLSKEKNPGNTELVVFLVRHAEKTENSRDPELSHEGQERTLSLANTLKDSGIEYIHSSDFIRTRETAAPLAKKLSLPVEIYNPRKLEEFAKELKEKRGRHLVVGHSNTTPQLVGLLGGNAGSEINEKSEYDRLYIVSDSGNGKVRTVLLRYGKAFEANDEQ